MQLRKPHQFVKMNKFYLIIIFLGVFSCEKSNIHNAHDFNEIAASYRKGLEIAEISNNFNVSFREALIKADRPIAYVTAIHVNFAKYSKVYEDSVLLLTVSMIIDKKSFLGKNFSLKSWNSNKQRYEHIFSTESKLVSSIPNTKLYECEVVFSVKMDLINRMGYCNIESKGEEDRLISILLADKIRKTFNTLHERFLREGLMIEGVSTYVLTF